MLLLLLLLLLLELRENGSGVRLEDGRLDGLLLPGRMVPKDPEPGGSGGWLPVDNAGRTELVGKNGRLELV